LSDELVALLRSDPAVRRAARVDRYRRLGT